MITPLMSCDYHKKVAPIVSVLEKHWKLDNVGCEIICSPLLPCRRLINLPDSRIYKELSDSLFHSLLTDSSDGFYIDIGIQEYSIELGVRASFITPYFEVTWNSFHEVITGAAIEKKYSYGKIHSSFFEGWCLYSKNCNWMIYIGYGFLLLGATPVIVEKFDEAFPFDYLNQIRDFLIDCREGMEVPFSLKLKDPYNSLVRLMIHVMGRKKGIALLEEFSFFSPDFFERSEY